MIKTNFKKKYKYNDPALVEFFVKNGYVIIKDLFDKKTINSLSNFINSKIKQLEKLHKKKKTQRDFELWSFTIIELLEKLEIYQSYISSPKLISTLQKFLGPDLCTLGYNSLWINNPSNNNPVINKTPHTDAWTGTSPNTLFFKVFLTDVDKYNGLTVYPGTNCQGMIPVKSRVINNEDFSLDFDPINLDNVKKGDAVLWHALTLHATTGQSDKNQRISMTARFTSTETEFSSQERALGYKALSVGPLNQIKRIIGNDQLYPLRTYNTYVGTDKRLAQLYNRQKQQETEKLKKLLR
tara:strand:+ start:249 stop:1136 length:888 start_codon:yes stop_codon:yes gene_type:complete